MREHYVSLRVKEKTKRLARELAAMNNMQIKDFVQMALEASKNEKKKQIKFGF